MDLALIDDDSLYQSVFREFFDNIGVNVISFSCGTEFMKAPLDELSTIKFIVIDHTILDTTTAELTNAIRAKIKTEICIVSTDGKALNDEKINNLGISGDFKKVELKNILSWYFYLKEEIEKRLQTWH